MKKLGFAVVGALSLVLAACGRNEADTLNEAEVQNYEAEALNDLAANAANAELEALGNQAQQLDAEENTAAEDATETDSNLATSPSEVEDDVQGM